MLISLILQKKPAKPAHIQELMDLSAENNY